MINIILIFPIIICILLFVIKSKILSFISLNLYALLHICVSLCYFFKLDMVTKFSHIPYFEIDGLNLIFLLILSVVFFASTIYNNGYIKNKNFDEIHLRKYVMAIVLFVFSMTGAILSSNLAVAWIFIEATTLASGYLIYFKKTKHSLEAAWKYIFMCSIGIALAFVGIILLSIGSGSLNSLQYSDLYANAHLINSFWLKLSFVFILFGIGTKMGLAPVHFWLPDAHAQAPSPISALLSASLLNCAYLIILKVYKILVIAGFTTQAKTMLFIMGFLSVFIAAIFLYTSKNYKRMLAYSSIENMGIITIATAVGGIGIYAAMLHLMGHSFTKAAFFLTSGNILTLFKSKKVKSASGIIKIENKTAWIFVVCCLAIIATPPSLLFISEFILLKQMFINNQYILVVLLLLLLTIIIYGITKTVFKMVFSQGQQEKLEIAQNNKHKIKLSMILPQLVLLILVFVLGVYMPNILDGWIKIGITGF